MRMGVTLKFLATTSGLLLAAFTGATLLILQAVQENHRDLVKAMLSEVGKNNKNAVSELNTGVDRSAASLAGAEKEIARILQELYESNCSRLIHSLASQIQPMIGNFDYDGAGKAVSASLKANKEIRWISFYTADPPKKSDIFEFGSKAAADDQGVKSFSWKNPPASPYLKIEMQVSMDGVKDFLAKVDAVFAANLRETRQISAQIEKSGEKFSSSAENAALAIGKEGSRKLTRLVVVFMAAVLSCVCLTLAFPIRKTIARPVGRLTESLTKTGKQVSSAAAQVSAASQSLAEGASEQAAGLEETSSTFEEISSMVKQNADGAEKAKTMTVEAKQIVNDVNQRLEEMFSAISDITRSTEETGKIIKTIDEIA
ncbi:MAG TPA: hypothetical protein VLS90_12860, partial [Thermodesulfobacteriota bacterium]|nr:hypothetical protein [Thermodesulfobacteriota bacterium]